MRIGLLITSLFFASVELLTLVAPLFWRDHYFIRKKIDSWYFLWIILAAFFLSTMWAVAFLAWSFGVSLYVKRQAGIKIEVDHPDAINIAKVGRVAVMRIDAIASLGFIVVIVLVGLEGVK